MVWEAIGSTLIGLTVAMVALRLIPARFASRGLTVLTGPAGGLVGGVLLRVVLGPGYAPLTLTAALAVSAAALSLLVRDPAARRPAAPYPA